MWWDLEDEIKRAALKKIVIFERHRKRGVDEHERRQRRSLVVVPKRPVPKPPAWLASPAHDPYHVYSRAASIAHSVRGKLQAGSYAPRPPLSIFVPKPGGGQREVSSFAIADEVVSRRLYSILLEKNRGLLSARSYAYRADLTALDAIAYVQAQWRAEQRLFVAEYDFSDFFGSISHEHIWSEVSEMGLRITSMEERLARAFITAPLPAARVAPGKIGPPRTRGVPQGTSISLLLANVAANAMDRELEGLAVRFVRYADDTLIWSRAYSEICLAVDALQGSAARMGVPLNARKSAGVRLLVQPEVTKAEMRCTHSVTYLSHEIGLRGTMLKTDLVDRVKAQIDKLIYNELIRTPLAGTQDLNRIGATDRDYVSLIWQLRRLFYGSMSENGVRRWSRGALPRITISGVFAQYPFVDAPGAYRSIDAWALNQVWLGLKKRRKLLSGVVSSLPAPWGMNKDQLLNLRVRSARTGDVVDLRFPSAERARLLVRRAVETHGTGVIRSGGGGSKLYG